MKGPRFRIRRGAPRHHRRRGHHGEPEHNPEHNKNNGDLGIVLAAPGVPPLDWMLDKHDFWREERENAIQELREWRLTRENAPFHFAVEDLARGIREHGYHNVAVGYLQYPAPSCRDAISQVINIGAKRVIVLPVICLPGHPFVEMYLPNIIAEARREHPDVDIVYGRPPFDRERHVDLLVGRIEAYQERDVEIPHNALPLDLLNTGERGTVKYLGGGHQVVSRLAALGFTPGVRIQVVQNYGHGPIIVSLRDSRIALGRGEAKRVRVLRGGS